VLPRFHHLTDQDVLARSFKLSDARELIAKRPDSRIGKHLLKGVHTLNDPDTETLRKPTLLAAEPQLFVSDLGASCEFYTKKLGFTVAFTYGEPPFYGQVFRDAARLNLRHLGEPAICPELRDREHLLSASITLDDAKPLFLEFQGAGVIFHQALKTEPWGARTFIVCDPDGNLILFAGRGR
jgi:catechol 2,3-dioxygenase-like lactoylglutathione lyase family enzyme